MFYLPWLEKAVTLDDKCLELMIKSPCYDIRHSTLIELALILDSNRINDISSKETVDLMVCSGKHNIIVRASYNIGII